MNRFFALGLGFLCTAAALGQDNAPPPAPPPAAQRPAPPPAAQPPASDQPGEKQAETPPAADRAEVDDEFIPTEELNPDAAVTFPVDI
jgi:hypothetical protein